MTIEEAEKVAKVVTVVKMSSDRALRELIRVFPEFTWTAGAYPTYEITVTPNPEALEHQVSQAEAEM